MKPYGKEWEEWVAGLSVGGKVAVRDSYYSTISYRIATIEKITKTGQIKVSGSDKRYKNGEEMGHRDSWGTRACLVPITEEVREHLKRSRLLSELRSMDFEKLTTSQLEEIKKIIERNESE